MRARDGSPWLITRTKEVSIDARESLRGSPLKVTVRLMALLLPAMMLVSTPRAVNAGLAEGCPEVILEMFGEASEAACAISFCETGGTFNEMARGRAGERGLFQIHPTWGANSTFDPVANAAFAFELSKGGSQWSRHWVRCAARYGLP